MILVFGTVCLDHIKQVPSLPAPGGYVEITDEMSFVGGEAANTALALKAWGRNVILAGNAPATDEAGDWVRNRLIELNLSNFELSKGRETLTPYCEIYVTPDGERTMFGRGFSAMADHIDLTALPHSKGDWFTADPNLGKTARLAAEQAKDAGMKLYLMDFNDATEPLGPGDVWQSSTDWIGAAKDVSGNLKIVQNMVSRTGATAILTDGPHGLFYCVPGGRATFIQGLVAPKTVDFTGAGDRFRAGMLNGFAHAWPLEKCLMFASAAGCLKCGSLGGTGYVHPESEVLRFLDERGA